MTSVTIRPANAADAPTIERMGRLAADWRGGGYAGELPPELARYVTGFGRAGDAGVVAEAAGEPVGAAWYRLFPAEAPGYGFVGDEVPELSIAVMAAHRGRGIGRRLLEALLDRAQGEDIARVSLSVAVENPAARLYRRLGFDPVGVNGDAWTMVAETGRRPS